MSIWTRIIDSIEALARGESFSDVLEKLTTPPEKSVAFAIAVIGLGAKMAKADGLVTANEVTAFRQIFHIPPREEANAARVFNLARQDVSGYDTYAATIAKMFRDDRKTLENLLEGLFVIATADGFYHPDEDQFLQVVADIFGLTEREFRTVRARSVADADPDPYAVLGVDPEDDLDTIRNRWRSLVRESHPDRLIARGVPEEAVKLATRQLARINEAWDEILNEKAA